MPMSLLFGFLWAHTWLPSASLIGSRVVLLIQTSNLALGDANLFSSLILSLDFFCVLVLYTNSAKAHCPQCDGSVN
ncbi:hypothetical protein CPB84DRAFT_1802292 [Gymnopilus junonius]|uniref:Uncharacterized protein n=1 Tax=Gymnopilus junonius TaxID=109634 RepID=A0A9P5TEN9_GYMJU|nr:hypothetical protein CPB84DRAFT_1802292 [Gymnopilus junonius]